MKVTCDIELNTGDGKDVVFTGQLLTWNIRIEFSGDVKIKGLEVELIGSGRCKWSEGAMMGTVPVPRRPSGEETYLREHLVLLAPGPGKHNILLPQGIHRFTNSYRMPLNLPSSCEVAGAHIRYCLQVAVKREGRAAHVFRRPFTLFSHVDLNGDLATAGPLELSMSKKMFGLAPIRGELAVSARLPSGGLVPGCDTNLVCVIHNGTGATVRRIYVVLEKYTRLVSNDHDVMELNASEVLRITNEKPDQTGKEIIIPLNIPLKTQPSLLHAKIIEIEYLLKIKFKLSGFHTDPVLTSPVIIGTIPLKESSGAATKYSYIDAVGDAPPSYEEAVIDNFDISSDEEYEKSE